MILSTRLCYSFQDIYSFLLLAIIQDVRQKLQKLKFFSFGRDTLYYPMGKNFAQNRSISYSFRDSSNFYFLLKSKMAAKSGENSNFDPLQRILL